MLKSECTHSINNVQGRMYNVHDPVEVRGNLVLLNQTWKSCARPVKGYGTNGEMSVTIRFDDSCKNGHMTFSITANVVTAESKRRRDIAAGGCMHEEIAETFPELAPLIKWHLVSTDGPMHYIPDTVYHAGNRDCHGLTAGEKRQIKNGKTGGFCWKTVAVDAKGNEFEIYEIPKYADGEKPDGEYRVLWVPRYRIGEGKERNLDAARSCAVWPEATDEELSVSKEELIIALEKRLPAILAGFRADMERIGFIWEVKSK